MKKITILLLTLSISIFSYAQLKITGQVKHDTIPLEFASIIIKNTKKGVATDNNGTFKIEAKKGDTLSVSYLGFETKAIIVEKSRYFDIELEVENSLDEVLIYAYECTRMRYSKRNCCCISVCGVEIERLDEEEVIGQDFKLFPNPSANGLFNIALPKNYKEVKVMISTITGQTIIKTNQKMFHNTIKVDLSQYPKGIYIINLLADGKAINGIKAIRG